VKEFWKSVNISLSYGRTHSCSFFDSHCIVVNNSALSFLLYCILYCVVLYVGPFLGKTGYNAYTLRKTMNGLCIHLICLPPLTKAYAEIKPIVSIIRYTVEILPASKIVQKCKKVLFKSSGFQWLLIVNIHDSGWAANGCCSLAALQPVRCQIQENISSVAHPPIIRLKWLASPIEN
jgi:hypothetical protein